MNRYIIDLLYKKIILYKILRLKDIFNLFDYFFNALFSLKCTCRFLELG